MTMTAAFSASALRNALAAAYGLDAERIVCGSGSDELLDLLARAWEGAIPPRAPRPDDPDEVQRLRKLGYTK